MAFNIPTKQDFLDNHKRAERDLLKYVAFAVFPCGVEGNEEASRFFNLWMDGKILLEPFWEQYGEIAEHQEQFKQFCKLQTGQGADWEQPAQKCRENELQEIQQETKENNDSWPSDESTKDISSFSDKLEKFMNQLPEDIINKFVVFFLSTKNFIAVNAAKAPSDMPKEAREQIPQATKQYRAQLSYEEKKRILEKLYPFWAFLDHLWGYKYTLSDQSVQRQEYQKRYKKAKFATANSSREKKKLAKVINSFFDSLAGEFAEFKEGIEKSILRAPLQVALQKLPQQATSARDEMHIVLPDVFKGCSQYTEAIWLLVKNQIIRESQPSDNKLLEEYIEHRKHCSQCRLAEEKTFKVMDYRYGRLKELISGPVYPKHEPVSGPIHALTPKQLVSYYKERYQKIPCELHKYYLALAYKQNREMKAAQKLLNQSSCGKVTVNHMGSVISVYCACGKEDMYCLNALRAPKITIGRLDEEDPLDIPQISVCQPDGLAMSRDMLSFEYQEGQRDWLVYPKMEQAGNLWVLSKDKLFNLLGKQMRIDGESSINYAEYFEPFTRYMWLSDIAGIGMFAESSVLFKGQFLQGVKHPLLGRLPFGWYIEAKAQRRDKTMMKSFAERSFAE